MHAGGRREIKGLGGDLSGESATPRFLVARSATFSGDKERAWGWREVERWGSRGRFNKDALRAACLVLLYPARGRVRAFLFGCSPQRHRGHGEKVPLCPLCLCGEIHYGWAERRCEGGVFQRRGSDLIDGRARCILRI